MILSAGPESYDRPPAQNVTWDDIDFAIQQLDERVRTTVTFGDPQSGIPIALPYMTVSGGTGRYWVMDTLDDSLFLILTKPDNPTGLVSLVVGGQRIEIEARQCVSLNQALKAAKVFFETREFDPSQTWTE